MLLGLLALCIFEVPLWCRPAELDKWRFASADAMCRPAGDLKSQIYLSGLPYLPPAVGDAEPVVPVLRPDAGAPPLAAASRRPLD